MGRRAVTVGVEVAEERELGAVVDHFAVDVEHEQPQRRVGERFRRPARPRHPLLTECPHRVAPAGVGAVETSQGGRGRQRHVVGLPVDGRPGEARRATDLEASPPSRDRRARRSWSPARATAQASSCRVARGRRGRRTFHAPATGSHRYSSSVSPSSRGAAACASASRAVREPRRPGGCGTPSAVCAGLLAATGTFRGASGVANAPRPPRSRRAGGSRCRRP